MSIAPYIERICEAEELTLTEARQLMDKLMTGQVNSAQIAGLLVALRGRGETAQEIAGFVQSMRSHLVPIPHEIHGLVDGCGTGGDGKGGFNVSTAAAVVAAAAGAQVAKHGNRSVSSRSGSADLLEACGAQIEQTPAQIAAALAAVGFAFMFAPSFHPAMRHVMPARKELGMRTIFNVLGPLTNPAHVKRQVIGVFNKATQSLMADVLNELGCEHVLVVHSEDGFDEFSIAAPTHVIEITSTQRREFRLISDDVGCRSAVSTDLAGGTPHDNKLILEQILAGKHSAHAEMVVLNAGALLYVSGRVGDIAEGIIVARDAIHAGKAREFLHKWVAFTRNGQ